MRAEDLVAELEVQYPDNVMAIDKLSDKERIEYIAVIKLIAHIKIIINPTGKKGL